MTRLWTERLGVRFQVGVRDFSILQYAETVSQAHLSSYSVDTSWLSSRIVRLTEVKWVEVDLHSPYMRPWLAQGKLYR
jgi:hypothetical protein